MANRDGKGDVARSPHALGADVPSLTPAALRAKILPFSEKAMNRGFGQMVRATRLRRGLSQMDLADRAGMHRTHISLIETGRRGVRLPTVCILAHALRMNPAELMPVLFRPDSTPVAHKALPIDKPRPPARPEPPAHL